MNKTSGKKRKRSAGSVVSFNSSASRSRPRKRQKNNGGGITSILSYKGISAPVSASVISTRKATGTHLEHFSDLFAAATVPSSSAAGDILVNRLETLANFGQRVSVLASLYQRWRLKALRYRWVSEVPTTTAGSLTMAHIDDASYTIPGAILATTPPGTTYTSLITTAIRSLMCEAEGAKTFPVWTPEVHMTVKPKKDWLYCNSLNVGSVTANLNANGVFLMIANSGLSGASTVGRVFVDAVIEFDKPDFNLAATIIPTANSVVEQITTTAAALNFDLKTAQGALTQAPFVIWIPSADIQISTSPVYYANQSVPQFMAYNPSVSHYNLFNSPVDFQTGTPALGTSAGGANIDTAAVFYYPASFN